MSNWAQAERRKLAARRAMRVVLRRIKRVELMRCPEHATVSKPVVARAQAVAVGKIGHVLGSEPCIRASRSNGSTGAYSLLIQ